MPPPLPAHEFVKGNKHFSRYYDGIYILFKTGLRISEFVGLTLADLDMKNRKISVNHQLQRKRNMEYIIEDTKTASGTRKIPMTDDVYQCFQRIIANRPKPKTEPMIGGRQQNGISPLDLRTFLLLSGAKLCYFMPGYAKRMSRRNCRKTPARPGISILSRGFRI